jgi:chromosomal replication initiation ATPase DnaA
VQPRQLVLPVTWAFSKKTNDYVLSKCNEYAFRWLEKWPFQKHDNFVCLVGEKGSGKTHLANIWAARQNADIMSATEEIFSKWYDLTSSDIKQKYFVLDDVDELKDDILLFYIYNTIQSQNAYLLMTAKTYPCNWQLRLDDVKSRMATVNVIRIQRPDEIAINSIIEKMLLQRGICTTAKVIEYIANRIERSYESINYWINQIDRSLVEKKTKISLRGLRSIINFDHNNLLQL